MVVGAASRAEEYKNRVLALDHAGILRLWGALCRGTRLRGWPPGRALEYLLLRAFQLEGAEVTWPYHVHVEWAAGRPQKAEQIDGAVYFDEVSCLIECKHHRRPIDLTPILRLKAQLSQRPQTMTGAVFSMSGFSELALELVRMFPPANVLVWRGAEIDLALQKRWLCKGMKMKLRYAKEHGIASMDLIEKRILT